jgi:hypothetical protein
MMKKLRNQPYAPKLEQEEENKTSYRIETRRQLSCYSYDVYNTTMLYLSYEKGHT